MKKFAALAACVLVAGCAADCGPDWYAIGARDGRLGADSQIERYAGRCGGPVDSARYAEGREAGLAMRPRTPYP